MRAIREDPAPEHLEYPCRDTYIKTARKELRQYELHGGHQHINAVIRAMKAAKELEPRKRKR